MNHVMLDLETWGTKPNAAIRSIGACVFDPGNGDIGSKFYVNVLDESCLDMGMIHDKDTERWWESQSAEAKAAFANDPQHIVDALQAFSMWWSKAKGEYVWGHGASFDPVLLEAAYHACLMEEPWKFWNVRCCRTVLAMASRKPIRTGGTHHNALDDAIAQAKAIAAAFRSKQFAPR